MKKIRQVQKNTGSQKIVTEAYLDVRLNDLKKNYLDVRLGELRKNIKDAKDEMREETRGQTAKVVEMVYMVAQQTKDEMREEMRGQTAQVLQAVDAIVTCFDAAEKEHAAHTILYQRMADELHGHGQRIKKLEAYK